MALGAIQQLNDDLSARLSSAISTDEQFERYKKLLLSVFFAGIDSKIYEKCWQEAQKLDESLRHKPVPPIAGVEVWTATNANTNASGQVVTYNLSQDRIAQDPAAAINTSNITILWQPWANNRATMADVLVGTYLTLPGNSGNAAAPLMQQQIILGPMSQIESTTGYALTSNPMVGFYGVPALIVPPAVAELPGYDNITAWDGVLLWSPGALTPWVDNSGGATFNGVNVRMKSNWQLEPSMEIDTQYSQGRMMWGGVQLHLSPNANSSQASGRAYVGLVPDIRAPMWAPAYIEGQSGKHFGVCDATRNVLNNDASMNGINAMLGTNVLQELMPLSPQYVSDTLGTEPVSIYRATILATGTSGLVAPTGTAGDMYQSANTASVIYPSTGGSAQLYTSTTGHKANGVTDRLTDVFAKVVFCSDRFLDVGSKYAQAQQLGAQQCQIAAIGQTADPVNNLYPQTPCSKALINTQSSVVNAKIPQIIPDICLPEYRLTFNAVTGAVNTTAMGIACHVYVQAQPNGTYQWASNVQGLGVWAQSAADPSNLYFGPSGVVMGAQLQTYISYVKVPRAPGDVGANVQSWTYAGTYFFIKGMPNAAYVVDIGIRLVKEYLTGILNPTYVIRTDGVAVGTQVVCTMNAVFQVVATARTKTTSSNVQIGGALVSEAMPRLLKHLMQDNISRAFRLCFSTPDFINNVGKYLLAIQTPEQLANFIVEQSKGSNGISDIASMHLKALAAPAAAPANAAVNAAGDYNAEDIGELVSQHVRQIMPQVVKLAVGAAKQVAKRLRDEDAEASQREAGGIFSSILHGAGNLASALGADGCGMIGADGGGFGADGEGMPGAAGGYEREAGGLFSSILHGAGNLASALGADGGEFGADGGEFGADGEGMIGADGHGMLGASGLFFDEKTGDPMYGSSLENNSYISRGKRYNAPYPWIYTARDIYPSSKRLYEMGFPIDDSGAQPIYSGRTFTGPDSLFQYILGVIGAQPRIFLLTKKTFQMVCAAGGITASGESLQFLGKLDALNLKILNATGYGGSEIPSQLTKAQVDKICQQRHLVSTDRVRRDRKTGEMRALGEVPLNGAPTFKFFIMGHTNAYHKDDSGDQGGMDFLVPKNVWNVMTRTLIGAHKLGSAGLVRNSVVFALKNTIKHALNPVLRTLSRKAYSINAQCADWLSGYYGNPELVYGAVQHLKFDSSAHPVDHSDSKLTVGYGMPAKAYQLLTEELQMDKVEAAQHNLDVFHAARAVKEARQAARKGEAGAGDIVAQTAANLARLSGELTERRSQAGTEPAGTGSVAASNQGTPQVRTTKRPDEATAAQIRPSGVPGYAQ